MDRKLKKMATAFVVFFVLTGLGLNQAEAQPGRSISLQTFYDELSDYGDWIDNPDYGYVWRPNVGRDFRPYHSNGRWAMTTYGNTWISDYEWGWAPFHYGRWFYDDYDGWIWTPDTVWGPAWVSWRTGGGYYGWAPLAPRISVNISFGRRYYVPDNYWVFIPQRCIYYPSYHRYWEPRRNVTIINHTTIINNTYINNRNIYVTGPRADEVRRATRQNVKVYNVNDVSRPGTTRVDRGAVNIYRPEVRNEGRSVSAPRTIANNSSGSRPSRSETRTVSGSDTKSKKDAYTARPERIDNGADRGQRTTILDKPSGENSVNRPDRAENSRAITDPSSSTQRPDRMERYPAGNQTLEKPERTETRSTERSSPSPRVERSPAPERTETRSTERSAPSPRVERSPAPERTETRSTERSAPAPRVERSPAPERSSGSSPDRSSSSGGGRPSRGN